LIILNVNNYIYSHSKLVKSILIMTFKCMLQNTTYCGSTCIQHRSTTISTWQ